MPSRGMSPSCGASCRLRPRTRRLARRHLGLSVSQVACDQSSQPRCTSQGRLASPRAPQRTPRRTGPRDRARCRRRSHPAAPAGDPRPRWKRAAEAMGRRSARPARAARRPRSPAGVGAARGARGAGSSGRGIAAGRQGCASASSRQAARGARPPGAAARAMRDPCNAAAAWIERRAPKSSPGCRCVGERERETRATRPPGAAPPPPQRRQAGSERQPGRSRGPRCPGSSPAPGQPP